MRAYYAGFLSALIFAGLSSSFAQTISTNTPIPPLQWINLTDSLGGARPPPLKDAVMGYDESSRSLIIFGGESSGGFPQSQTYILNLQTLQWSTPSPPDNLRRTPSARSSAIGGVDNAASNRHGFVVIGGKDSGGRALSDVWEFDFINQFWSEVSVSPGGPPPRWGSAGGIDLRTPPAQDPVVPGPNNTFYIAGGFNGATTQPLSDVWMLNVSGTLSSNLPDSVAASWQRVSITPSLSSQVNQGGTIIGHQIVAVGGCGTASSDRSCANRNSYIIDLTRSQVISPDGCPAPRLSPTVISNTNPFSTRFASQAFLLLGIFNASLWDDGGGLEKGEVAVLDINTGSWARILPSGDPGASGKQAFPGPREGASAFSFPQALVGSDRNISSDTIIYGGRDVEGRYLSEVWLLRAYSGELSSTSERWSGYGNGQLQTGANANGAGVSVSYLSQCAVAISPTQSSTSSSLGPSATQSPPGSPTSPQDGDARFFPYDTSTTHKLLAPLSLAIFQVAFLVLRQVSPWFNTSFASDTHLAWTYLPILAVIVAHGVGVAGIATAFTSISATSSIAKRAEPSLTLQTLHGQVGLAFFVGLFGLVPILLALGLLIQFLRRPADSRSEKSKATSIALNEKNDPHSEPISRPQSEQNVSPPSLSRQRVHSWGPSTLWQRSTEGRLSDDSESMSSGGPTRTFEVLNRPARNRKKTGASLAIPMNESPSHIPRNLSDVDWLQRRRSLNAVGELDYALTQASRPTPSTPHTMDALVPPGNPISNGQPFMPSLFASVVHILLHVFLLALSIITLIALWRRAPRAAFAVFLAWTIIFYVIMFISSWRGRPNNSLLSSLCYRIRTDPHQIPALSASPTPQSIPADVDQYPFPTDNRGPYVHHQPTYRVAPSDYSHGPRSVETDDDIDEDDDARQRQMEEEMSRRDVSIVTVPRRKLWITNPS
ncbi:hypothetical protein BDN71DRAFT_1447071 [Pleurotus eryngii]|uniref:Uncharacterized protein n=1 Tax=Pleurotus eryngii TaxID=5323 RepID=A0A9P6D7E1_PLEER|nr:hypothetical protein BDN71DRAFT_1447071 [Pleurotus eryngii]